MKRVRLHLLLLPCLQKLWNEFLVSEEEPLSSMQYGTIYGERSCGTPVTECSAALGNSLYGGVPPCTFCRQ